MICKRCGEEITPYVVIMDRGPNYAKEICPSCESWIKWLPKPENEKRRRNGSKYTPESLEIYCCELCRRRRDQLGKRGTLHIHHKDGNYKNDVPDNLLVLCTSCHELVHLHKKSVNGEYGIMFTDESMQEIDYKEVPF